MEVSDSIISTKLRINSLLKESTPGAAASAGSKESRENLPLSAAPGAFAPPGGVPPSGAAPASASAGVPSGADRGGRGWRGTSKGKLKKKRLGGKFDP